MKTATIARRDLLVAGAASSVALSAWPTWAKVAGPAIKPFTYRAPDATLTDLKRRLSQTRWPEAETGLGWSQGAPLANLRTLVDYWRDGYDWRRCEAALATIPQFRTTIDGLGIHFIHARSKHANALPILMTHGWPGSVIEFMEIVGPLTDPTSHGGRAENAFHFIAPSLPGFGFSDKPSAQGWNADRIARAWGELMQRLGYTRYIAQGGDWGAVVTTKLAQQRPPGLAAIHLTFPQVMPEPVPTTGLSPTEQRYVDQMKRFQTDGYGYFLLQATRPQTVGYALADSPVAQAGWLYGQFQAWTDNTGLPESALTRDQMLDDITLYWLTNTSASSARIYLENFPSKSNLGRVDLPVGCSIFPHEIFQAPRTWAKQVFPGLIYWNEPARGGHFAAFEEPELFVQEMRGFARTVREQT